MPLPPSMISLSRLFACLIPKPVSAVSATTVLVLARPALHFLYFSLSSPTEHLPKFSDQTQTCFLDIRSALRWILSSGLDICSSSPYECRFSIIRKYHADSQLTRRDIRVS